MNIKFKKFIYDFGYVLTSNIVSFLISLLVVLIIPKIIGVFDYGYWQLYIFYAGYIGFLHFGWNDGVYLRYGGKKYEDLDKSTFSTQFLFLFLFQLVIAFILYIFTTLFIVDTDKSFILTIISFGIVIVNTKALLQLILQITNRIKDYSISMIIDRFLYFVFLVTVLFLGESNYKILIYCDMLAKSFTLIYLVYLCRDLVFNSIQKTKDAFVESWKNISVGIKLMISNIASLLIIGTVRLGVDYLWNIETFGKVSLSLSISNLLLLMINAISIILFPTLRRISKDKYADLYLGIRNIYMFFAFGLLFLYYPINYFLSLWLPDYSISLIYLGILFPICIYEGKMALLINTYFKTLRKEKTILKVNFTSFLISLLLTLMSVLFIQNLDFMILSIVIILGFRSIYAEKLLVKMLNVQIPYYNFFEIILVLMFILPNMFLQSDFLKILIYFLSFLIYSLLKKNNIIDSVLTMKKYIYS